MDVQHIIEVIKKRRLDKNLTQTDVADYLGITQNSYKQIEKGATQLKVEVLISLATFLDIDLKMLFSDEEEDSGKLVALKESDMLKFMENLAKHQVENAQMMNDRLERMEEMMRQITGGKTPDTD